VQRLGPESAPTVVFVHGLVMDNLSSFYYTLAAPLAARGFGTVLFDLRGHGLSERPPSGYTPEESALDLVAVLDEIGVTEPVYLLGNSYGGVVAMHTAVQAPDRVGGVVLVESACGGVVGDAWFEDITNTLTVAALGLEFDRTQDQLMALGQRKIARLAVNANALLNGTTLIDDLGSGAKLDLTQVQCPVLGVFGAESELIGAAAELQERIPSCRLHVVSGLGHTVLREATAELLDVLLDWLPS
jgi:pimeloyl-ACP methyl ester carboxylesterase